MEFVIALQSAGDFKAIMANAAHLVVSEFGLLLHQREPILNINIRSL